jgi:AraC-like DNA-binding protein
MPDLGIRHSLASVRHLVRAATDRGAALDACLEGTGIRPEHIGSTDAEITAEQELRVIRNVQKALPEARDLAFEVGMQYQLTDFGIWGYALISSSSLREAMKLSLRYLDLSYIFGELIFEEIEKEERLRFDYGAIPADIRQFLLERDVAAIYSVSQQVYPNARSVRHMYFGFPAPPYADRLRVLLGIPLDYDAPDTVAVLDPKVLDEPLPQANEATLRMCEAECRKLLARRRARSGVSAKVRDFILRQPNGSSDMDSVAAELHMTARTLRRHLADEGTTFRALREEVLLMLAEELLGTARMKLDEVAERLGYADAAAFSHAFKRWSGVAPGEFRGS